MTAHQRTLVDVIHELRTKADAWTPGSFRDGLHAALDAVAREMHLDKLNDPTTNTNIDGRRDTSRAAALQQVPRSGSQRMRVLEALAELPASDEQLASRLGLAANTIRPRRLELFEGGWVCDSGQRAVTRSGARAIVWTLTVEGTDRLAAHRANADGDS